MTRHLQAHPFYPVSWVAHLPRAAKRRLGLTLSEPNFATAGGVTEAIRFNPDLDDARMSARSMRLLSQTSHDLVRSVRRRNYERLVEAVQDIRGLEPLFPTLPEATCPVVLPFFVSDLDSFRHRLAASPGIGVRRMWPWFHPSADWDVFPYEKELKRSVFQLPVHQSLQSREIDRIITTMRSWSLS